MFSTLECLGDNSAESHQVRTGQVPILCLSFTVCVYFFSGFQSEIGGEDSVIDALQELMRGMSQREFLDLVDEITKKNTKTYKAPSQQVNGWGDSQSSNSYPSYMESFLAKKNLDIDTRDLQDNKNFYHRYSKRKLVENTDKTEDLRQIISAIEGMLEED